MLKNTSAYAFIVLFVVFVGSAVRFFSSYAEAAAAAQGHEVRMTGREAVAITKALVRLGVREQALENHGHVAQSSGRPITFLHCRWPFRQRENALFNLPSR